VSLSDLEGYVAVAECERKIAALERAVAKLELRLEATIKTASDTALGFTLDRLRAALESDEVRIDTRPTRPRPIPPYLPPGREG